MFGAEFPHPCFSGALEVLFDFGLCFIYEVHKGCRIIKAGWDCQQCFFGKIVGWVVMLLF